MDKAAANLRSKIIIIALVGLAALIRLINGPRPNDDAFITFRYVENITNGVGFVYNAGEKVLGTTTPLYTLLLSLLHFPFQTSLPWLGLLLNTVADCGTVVLLWLLGRRFCTPNRLGFEFIAPLLFAVSVFSTNWCIANMETSLFSFLLLCAFYLAITAQTRSAAFVAGLAALCRPEGVLIVLLAFAAIWARNKRLPWREGLIILAVGLPWAIFATLYFGNPLPQSLLAKGDGVYIFSETGLARLRPFSLLAWDTPFGQFLTNAKLPEGKKIFALGLALTLLFLGLVAAGLWRIWKTDRVAFAFAFAFPLFFNLAYILAQFRNVLIFDWYLVPLVPWYLLLVGVGLAQVAAWLVTGKDSGDKLTPVQIGLRIVLPVFLGIAVVNQLQAYDFGRTRMQSPTYYQTAAQVLAPRLKATDTIITNEIGMLGYYAPARIFDSVGLVSPEALKYYPIPANELASNNAIPSRMINELKPEYVVSLELFVRNSLKLSPQFMSGYTLLQKIPSDMYGSDGLLIFIRNDLLK